MLDETHPLPDFTRWPSFPFEGDMRVKPLHPPVDVEPARSGEDPADCVACNTPDDSYIWVSERWRVRGLDRPTGLPIVLILECRSHLDLGDLPNLLAAELGVMTVRLERAIRSLDGVARVHVNRWGDGSAHLHMWFLARPQGQLQLRGTFLSLWDDILPVIPEEQWLDNLALVAAWLAGFGGRAIAEPAHIQWESPATFDINPPAPAGPSPADTRGAPAASAAMDDPATSASSSATGLPATVAVHHAGPDAIKDVVDSSRENNEAVSGWGSVYASASQRPEPADAPEPSETPEATTASAEEAATAANDEDTHDLRSRATAHPGEKHSTAASGPTTHVREDTQGPSPEDATS
ncbi:hypothetical protein [Actinoplanes sp. TFC3]|uniref:hypothetical protein n=1 Tax=Actinoplanes sp. TFC3 TaxID=1710355 RepID=UPI0009EB104E|nr:hypothetical protein [Actinoplanes sp. TFC3]